MLPSDGFEYLGSPYTHPDLAVRLKRFEIACKAAAILMERGIKVFCPIAHSHVIEVQMSKQYGFDFWMGQDKPLLRKASRLRVLMLEGWEKSRGLKEEIETAYKCGIPVIYTDPVEIFGA